ncbi:MAG: light harvesting protein subunit alpha, partial [Persicimonas sp.]
ADTETAAAQVAPADVDADSEADVAEANAEEIAQADEPAAEEAAAEEAGQLKKTAEANIQVPEMDGAGTAN